MPCHLYRLDLWLSKRKRERNTFVNNGLLQIYVGFLVPYVLARRVQRSQRDKEKQSVSVQKTSCL